MTESLPSSGEGEWLDETLATLKAFRDERGWAPLHTPRNLATSVAIEAGELLQHFQWLTAEDAKSEGPCGDLEGEIADVMIYLVYLADSLGISLADAVDRKISLNDQRYPAADANGADRRPATRV